MAIYNMLWYGREHLAKTHNIYFYALTSDLSKDIEIMIRKSDLGDLAGAAIQGIGEFNSTPTIEEIKNRLREITYP